MKEELNIINDENSSNSYSKNLKKLIKYLNNSNDSINIINNDTNYIEKFIDEPNIIKNTSNLIGFIEELKNQLNSGNNILIPFLDICPILIKSYIECDIDEGKELEYIEVFKLLKINSFINREYLCPIYEYFSDIFYVIKDIDENDKQFKKFNKVVELWKIFYDFDINKDKLNNYNSYSYCFIGGGLQVHLSKEIKLDDNIFTIKICLLNYLIYNLNEKSILFRVDNNLDLTIHFSSLIKKDIFKHKKGKIINLSFKLNEIIIQLNSEDNETFYNETLPRENLKSIKDFYLLDQFYGQIKYLEFIESQIISNNKKILIDKIFEPYPLTDKGVLYQSNKIEINSKEKNKDNITNNDLHISINIIKKNLVKANYINYLENNFELLDYIGGFTPFIPFIPLINGINTNQKINIINGKNKKEYLNNFVEDILYLFSKMVVKYKVTYAYGEKKILKKIRKYMLFVFCLIFQIDYEILYYNRNQKEPALSKICEIIPLLLYLDDKENLCMYFLGKINNNNLKIDTLFTNDKPIFKEQLSHIYSKQTNPLFIKSTYKQLFRSIIKELFIYNRFWSKKEIFFKENNNENNLKLKYKQISYYTKNFQQPLLYPILNINEYLPSFSKFEIKNLFNHPLDKCVNYEFNFIENSLTKILREAEPLRKEKKRVNCCLVKKHYHIKGEIIIIQRKIVDYQFEMIFCSNPDLKGDTCNKIKDENSTNNNQKINSNKCEICYGSNFPCLEKEFNRKLLIKSKDIKFIIIRNYFRKESAIEIFTFKSNKSYYFNFQKIIDLINFNNNIILQTINEDKNFIKYEFKKEIIVFYNKAYENVMFPLFYDKPSKWDNKKLYYNNYDLLTIINLLSNRSFKDLYQYPVFPILYKPNRILENEANKERDLSEHLGIQELTEKCRARKQIIVDSYKAFIENFEQENDEESEPCLFNTHYSNPVYTCNYLLRVFPYSLPAIEFQGDGFDSPNRLFYSVNKTMENTLTQKSDLREFIPEMYYFPDLFYNINELKLGTLIEGGEIDTVFIDKKDENNYKKYEYLDKIKYYLDNTNLKLNYWIDLIFGINQKVSKNKELYYEKYMYIHFDDKEQAKILNNPLNMQKFEFGIQPLALFDKKFPELKDDDKKQFFSKIKQYNVSQFNKERLIINDDKNKCFICEGFINFNFDYINIINNKIINKKKPPAFFHYIFTGDVLGNITIYKNRYNGINNSNLSTISVDKNYKIMKKLTDHYKQIKYIDYNPRLNLFLSYSLDGFINIYVFPKCKLVRAIKVKNITKSVDILQKVILVSNPFPMIFTYDKKNMYTITLNGELIKFEELQYKEVHPCIDKNCGITNDCIYLISKNEANKEDKKKKIYLPSLLSYPDPEINQGNNRVKSFYLP